MRKCLNRSLPPIPVQVPVPLPPLPVQIPVPLPPIPEVPVQMPIAARRVVKDKPAEVDLGEWDL